MKKGKRKRLEAAEEVCWTLMLMIGVGELNLPLAERKMIYEPLDVWATRATKMGIMCP